jgi:putative CocE/NonD family hydrolase
VARGYAYVHLDVRGSGRSEGEYGFFNRRERRDLYEVIEWVAKQPWSNGKVGGIGQSYYAASQWCMAAESPPHLACVAPYDGHIDFYRGWYYSGGIQSNFAQVWWNGSVRIANKFPANGAEPRDISYDLVYDLMQHPLQDGFWEERSIDAQLARATVPVYSIGVWVKRDLHLAGNIRGFHLVKGPKKLFVSGVPTLPQTLAEYASSEFHEQVLAPFYDHFLKGEPTNYLARPAVEFHLVGANSQLNASEWPPAEVHTEALFLQPGPSGTLTSLNDGKLGAAPVDVGTATSYSYPDPQWAIGPVALTAAGPDPIRRVVTYTSAALQEDLTVTGAPVLILHLSSTRTDAVVITKLSVQHPQSPEERTAGKQPASTIVAKGWLRASHRALNMDKSIRGELYIGHSSCQPLIPGQPYELRVELTPLAFRFNAGSRIRLELCCADSTVTDLQFTHVFTPDMVGTDTFHHSAALPSRLLLPILKGHLN